jgi:hypothetical protein
MSTNDSCTKSDTWGIGTRKYYLSKLNRNVNVSNSLTLWSRILLEKMIDTELIIIFPAFSGTRRFTMGLIRCALGTNPASDDCGSCSEAIFL